MSPSGSSTTVCPCGELMEYDYLDEVWRHLNDGQIECEDTGQNEDPTEEPLMKRGPNGGLTLEQGTPMPVDPNG